MHPNNLYLKKKPDFAELSKRHGFFTPYVTVVNNKGHVDFKNKDALRALTRAILLEDFRLDVIIPPESLVPVIPQRLNYILWIEDLFGNQTDQLRGLDIGTGGTAIYALLCARKNNWKMVGTDIVEESIQFAKQNIERNGLNELVEAQLTHRTSAGDFFSEVKGNFHFSMCNPPFFSSEEETNSLAKARNLTRPSPSGAKTGISMELVASGGEVAFLNKMIAESRQFASTIGIFTTMVGIKSDLKLLKNAVTTNSALSYTTTKFVQGKTMRWGLAWTFDPKYAPRLSTPLNPRVHVPLKVDVNCSCESESFILNLKRQFANLEFRFLDRTTKRFEVFVDKNTWSNQRRKRRAALRYTEKAEPNEKRVKPSEECTEERVNGVASCNNDSDFPAADLKNYEEKQFALHIEVTFRELDIDNARNRKEFWLKYLGGTFGSVSLHQVIQYLRNVFATHTCSTP